MAKYNTLSALFTAIANSLRSKTGGSAKIVADDFPSVIDELPTGGITPSGTKTITTNGTHDVASFASALVNVKGLNARVLTTTVSADATSGSPTLFAANEWLASIRSNPNAFVLVRYLGVEASKATIPFWFTSNFKVGYGGTSAYNSIVLRQTASALSGNFNVNGLTGENYSGHLCMAADGRLYLYANTTYPLRAGDYQIIAGTVEMIPDAS